MNDVEVVVIGAGAAGIAAAHRLTQNNLTVLVLEAQGRIGGRAWTIRAAGDLPLDLGCGWLHSADENDWAAIAAQRGVEIDQTPPPWRTSRSLSMSDTEMEGFRAAWDRLDERLDEAAKLPGDRAAADFLEPGGRWNKLLSAISTFINGVELDQLSVQDFARYQNTAVNWRTPAGYGTLIEAFAGGLNIELNCAATLIDHSGARLRIETPRGAIGAGAVIVTVSSNLLAEERPRFVPALPEKLQAAHALPLGFADKLFLSLDGGEDLPKNGHLFGATDRVATATYHLRPFGRPLIEGYFGGDLAHELEREGAAGFAEFGIDEIVSHLGGDMRKRLSLITASAWAHNRHVGGAYSHASIGSADARSVLAAAVDDRLFFAGEACSIDSYSTAHGAYRTGVAAAEQVIARGALMRTSAGARRQV